MRLYKYLVIVWLLLFSVNFLNAKIENTTKSVEFVVNKQEGKEANKALNTEQIEKLKMVIVSNEKELTNNPSSEKKSQIYYDLGNAYLLSKSNAKANEYYSKFLYEFSNDERVSNVKLLQGVIFFSEKKYDEAINIFKQVILTYPDSLDAPCAQYKIGDCYLKLEKSDLAKDSFQKVIDKYKYSRFRKYSERMLSALNKQ